MFTQRHTVIFLKIWIFSNNTPSISNLPFGSVIYIIILSIRKQWITASISKYIRSRHRVEIGSIFDVSRSLFCLTEVTVNIQRPRLVSYLCGKLLHCEDGDSTRISELSTILHMSVQYHNPEKRVIELPGSFNNDLISNETSFEINLLEHQDVISVSTRGRGH